jgi:micrococcal nuclease
MLWLKGQCISVSDGDTFRFLHQAHMFQSTRLEDFVRKKKEEEGGGAKLSESTLAVRVCTIDTPETAKFGQPGQPHGDAAKDHLSALLLDRKCEVRLLQADQYGRAVAEVRCRRPRCSLVPFLFRRTVYADEHMLAAGLAEVYRGQGATYGRRGKEHYEQLQEEAQRQRIGMWSSQTGGAANAPESAAEYKARMKEEKRQKQEEQP